MVLENSIQQAQWEAVKLGVAHPDIQYFYFDFAPRSRSHGGHRQHPEKSDKIPHLPSQQSRSKETHRQERDPRKEVSQWVDFLFLHVEPHVAHGETLGPAQALGTNLMLKI